MSDLKKMLPLSKNIRGILVALSISLVPFVYFLLIGRYGWSDQDDGYMLGFAWRVHNGKLPYRDFIYLLPPFSAFLHSIWFDLFPPKFLYAGTRLVAIYQNWIIALLASTVLCKHCFSDDETLRRNWLGVAVAAFLFSVCGLTPMPWYTTDGILFGLLGAAILILRRGVFASILASIALLLSAGTKQSFYPLIFFVLLYLFFSKRMKEFCVVAASFAVLVIAASNAMQRYGMSANYFSMTSGLVHGHDALKAGIFEYLHIGVWSFGRILLLITVPLYALCLVFRKRFRPEFVIPCFFIGILIQFARQWHIQLEFVSMARGGYSQLLFVLSFFYGIWRLYRKGEKSEQTLGFLLLLTISWCASLSLGYLAPIMFSAPLLVGGYLILTEHFAGSKERVLAFSGVGVVVIVMFSSLYPYGDLDGRLHDHFNLGSVEPAFSFIVSGNKTAEKLKEFEALRREFPGTDVTLPAFQWSYILNGIENPLATDWPQKIQVGPREPLLEAQLDHGARYAFVDKTFSIPLSDPYGVPLIGYVAERWKLAYDGVWYRVYENVLLPARKQQASAAGKAQVRRLDIPR